MKYNNPFSEKTMFNNPEAFKMPYQLYGRTDLEVMTDKFNKLINNSYGCIVRFIE